MSPETTVSSRNVSGVEYPAVGTYTIDASHTELGFAVRHMAVSKVRGRFSTFEGTIEIAEQPADSKASLTIEAGTVDTRDETRDAHLRTNDFFDVANHPTWTFVSTSIKPEGLTEFKVEGDLTIRGVTRQVTLDATLEGVVTDPYGNHRIGFSASTSINRDDFGVSFGAVMEAGGLVVAKKVDIQIELEAVLQA
ncbi:MAG TPA: YceI family protein [Acidimicrobiales bacterium]|jgi:polyisoprenoid-binding protein YceI|nr:YceI family protein [Acidimicrobiales bacterium]